MEWLVVSGQWVVEEGGRLGGTQGNRSRLLGAYGISYNCPLSTNEVYAATNLLSTTKQLHLESDLFRSLYLISIVRDEEVGFPFQRGCDV